MATFALLAGGSLIASGCLKESSTDVASGDGVATGASKEDYMAAFADVAESEITIQSVSTKGEGASVPIEAMAAELEEWSDGKLSVEIVYGNAVSQPAETPQALAEGRVDMDYIFPVYDPSRFPANAAFADTAFIGDHSPVAGTLSTFAGLMEAGMADEGMMKEMEDAGLKLLMPFTPNTSVGMMCTDKTTTLSDLKGKQIRVSGAVQSEQVKALGATPVSLPYSEQYEALQRGTIDCALSAAYASITVGIIPLAPNFTTGEKAGFARVAAPYAFGLDKWNSLPLVAQQLIFDRMITWVKIITEERMLKVTKKAVSMMLEEGGSLSTFAKDAAAALEKENDALLAGLGKKNAYQGAGDLAARAEDAVNKWHAIAVDEFGLSEEQFAAYAKSGDEVPDVKPFLDRFWEEVMTQYRPQ